MELVCDHARVQDDNGLCTRSAQRHWEACVRKRKVFIRLVVRPITCSHRPCMFLALSFGPFFICHLTLTLLSWLSYFLQGDSSPFSHVSHSAGRKLLSCVDLKSAFYCVGKTRKSVFTGKSSCDYAKLVRRYSDGDTLPFTAPSLCRHCTITALHHPCTITVPSLHLHDTFAGAQSERQLHETVQKHVAFVPMHHLLLLHPHLHLNKYNGKSI